jgi:hypothetical protein
MIGHRPGRGFQDLAPLAEMASFASDGAKPFLR